MTFESDVILNVVKCKKCGQLIGNCASYEKKDFEKALNRSDVRRALEENKIIFENKGKIIIEGGWFSCPICGSTDCYKTLFNNYNPSRGDRLQSNFFYNVYPDHSFRAYDEKTKREVAEFIHKEDAAVVEPEYSSILNDCKNSVNNDHAISFNNNIDIKKYLESLLAIKTGEYSLESRLRQLLYSKYSISQDCINEALRILPIILTETTDKLKTIEKRIDEISKDNPFSILPLWNESLGIERPVCPRKPKNFCLTKPKEPVYEKPGFFNKKAVTIANEKLKEKYNEELNGFYAKQKEYELAYADYEKAMDEYLPAKQAFLEKEEEFKKQEYEKWLDKMGENAEWAHLIEEKKNLEAILLNPQVNAKDIIDNYPARIASKLNADDINECLISLKKAYQAECDYLSTGILFPKYSTLPAVSSIYEYFITGRCSELSGSNGAYNLYESELRADSVIEKLDIISKKLDEIKNNQYILYNAVKSVNSQLSQLSSSTDKMRKEINTGLSITNTHLEKISENSAAIEYNTGMTAYYSKRNAELTDALGYLIAMK